MRYIKQAIVYLIIVGLFGCGPVFYSNEYVQLNQKNPQNPYAIWTEYLEVYHFCSMPVVRDQSKLGTIFSTAVKIINEGSKYPGAVNMDDFTLNKYSLITAKNDTLIVDIQPRASDKSSYKNLLGMSSYTLNDSLYIPDSLEFISYYISDSLFISNDDDTLRVILEVSHENINDQDTSYSLSFEIVHEFRKIYGVQGCTNR